MSHDAETEAVLSVHRDFYHAFEEGDFDAMTMVWAEDDGVVCVHPGSTPLHGYHEVMRSWLALMAGAHYIQFFLTDVQTVVFDDVASVTCRENVLTAGSETPQEGFAGGSAVATNVFRRTSEGWRLWVHHSSPVLSAAEDTDNQGEDP